MSDNSSKRSGWETADKVAHGAGKALNGIAFGIVKIYGVLLVLAGLAVLFIIPAKGWWAGLMLVVYGIYLLAPGSKFVVW
ncbi:MULTISPECIES: hypothetical protein [Arthrobacter]|uniref:Uncharacterized protein n=1 Tax=Arthrobacter terricola TaxID=2547396 RepID=A0A4R5KDY4_9MICC|nr:MULTISPECIES: hypothetical protein [Arthrobacter]MBT8162589.1 hypothetical protein [Arthrobacter sp. GN70]TDF92855.1 hypothetical protein E1809_16985 [Arthrobacter terricola]